jgi:hypothetical protein
MQREELFPEREPKIAPSKIFVEIGFGDHPAILSGDPYFNNCYYDGIDQNHDKLIQAKQKIIKAESSHLHTVNLYTASLEDLELPQEAIDEIYMANVFAPHAEAQRHALEELEASIIYQTAEEVAKTEAKLKQANGDWVKFAPGERPFSNMLNQLGKIRAALKSNGQLTIVETNTPTDAPILIDAVKGFGLVSHEIVTPEEQPRWQELAQRYTITMGMPYFKQPPYILIAYKA